MTVIRKVIVMIAVTEGGRDRNKVSSWGSGREFIGRFIVNINLGATQAETKAVIFHSSSLFMDPSKNTATLPKINLLNSYCGYILGKIKAMQVWNNFIQTVLRVREAFP